MRPLGPGLQNLLFRQHFERNENFCSHFPPSPQNNLKRHQLIWNPYFCACLSNGRICIAVLWSNSVLSLSANFIKQIENSRVVPQSNFRLFSMSMSMSIDKANKQIKIKHYTWWELNLPKSFWSEENLWKFFKYWEFTVGPIHSVWHSDGPEKCTACQFVNLKFHFISAGNISIRVIEIYDNSRKYIYQNCIKIDDYTYKSSSRKAWYKLLLGL